VRVSTRKRHQNALVYWQFPLVFALRTPSRSSLYLHLITFAFVNASPRAERQALMEPGVSGEGWRKKRDRSQELRSAPKKGRTEKRKGPSPLPANRAREREKRVDRRLPAPCGDQKVPRKCTLARSSFGTLRCLGNCVK